MTRAWVAGALTCAFAAVALCDERGDTHTSAPREQTPISVEDIVSQAVIGDPMSPTSNDSDSPVIEISPDRERAAVIVRRGNPENGTNDAQLLVYQTNELLGHPQAKVAASFASATNYQPISLVRWQSDSQTVTFAGGRGRELPQVYQADLQTNGVKQLTELNSALLWYGVTATGDWLATISEPDAPPSMEQDSECQQRGCLVTADTLYAAEHGNTEESAPLRLYDLHRGSDRTFASPESNDPGLARCADALAGGISPDGRFGLRLCKLRSHRWPAWWAEYKTYPQLDKLLTAGVNGLLGQWILYDFKSGESKRLGSAPYFRPHVNSNSEPLWIDGGRRFILAGALETLQNIDREERQRRATHYAIVIIDPLTQKVESIAALDSGVVRVATTGWDQKSGTVRVGIVGSGNKPLPDVLYRRTGDRWTQIAAQSVDNAANRSGSYGSRPQLVVQQSLNHPPALNARNPMTGAIRTVLDPNPWLARRAVAHVEVISWKSKDGSDWSGGLYYPPTFKPGARYPVVLQTHGFNRSVFSLYGSSRNFAAQALAGQGILVLQIEENMEGAVGVGAEEWSTAQAGYEAAVDKLDSLGLIDRDRVGIQGWSRTGPYVGYTLTHSPYSFAAGTFTNTVDFGWWYYLLEGAPTDDSHYGMQPFGAGLNVWQKMAPSFNLDRVHTPMLLCAGNVAGLWDWYVGLRHLGEPVEYWSLPDVSHDVFKVGERIRINQLLVDWFRFWLKGEEDAVPPKVAQYARWHALRQQRDVNLATLGQRTSQ